MGRELKFKYYCEDELRFKNFDAEAIARRTHGILFSDVYWLRFDDEDFGWEDVKEIREMF